MTHFATADEDPEFMAEQLERFAQFAAHVRSLAPQALVHAANSAGTLRDSGAQFDLVRCGVALYGLDPFGEDPAAHGLEPALALRSYLAAVKPAAPGQSTGYGRRFIAERPTWIGTAPIGYGDGVRRALHPEGQVLIAGRRHPIVGNVSMDNITVDLGPEPASGVEVGAPVTLIGPDGGDRILVEELARWVGTINYEIVTGISARVPAGILRMTLESGPRCPARGRSRARPGSSAARCATSCSAGRCSTSTLPLAEDPAATAAGLARAGARVPVPAVGGVRRLAGRRPRAGLADRPAPACRARTWRPTSPRAT